MASFFTAPPRSRLSEARAPGDVLDTLTLVRGVALRDDEDDASRGASRRAGEASPPRRGFPGRARRGGASPGPPRSRGPASSRAARRCATRWSRRGSRASPPRSARRSTTRSFARRLPRSPRGSSSPRSPRAETPPDADSTTSASSPSPPRRRARSPARSTADSPRTSSRPPRRPSPPTNPPTIPPTTPETLSARSSPPPIGASFPRARTRTREDSTRASCARGRRANPPRGRRSGLRRRTIDDDDGLARRRRLRLLRERLHSRRRRGRRRVRRRRRVSPRRRRRRRRRPHRPPSRRPLDEGNGPPPPVCKRSSASARDPETWSTSTSADSPRLPTTSPYPLGLVVARVPDAHAVERLCGAVVRASSRRGLTSARRGTGAREAFGIEGFGRVRRRDERSATDCYSDAPRRATSSQPSSASPSSRLPNRHIARRRPRPRTSTRPRRAATSTGRAPVVDARGDGGRGSDPALIRAGSDARFADTSRAWWRRWRRRNRTRGVAAAARGGGARGWVGGRGGG